MLEQITIVKYYHRHNWRKWEDSQICNFDKVFFLLIFPAYKLHPKHILLFKCYLNNSPPYLLGKAHVHKHMFLSEQQNAWSCFNFTWIIEQIDTENDISILFYFFLTSSTLSATKCCKHFYLKNMFSRVGEEEVNTENH